MAGTDKQSGAATPGSFFAADETGKRQNPLEAICALAKLGDDGVIDVVGTAFFITKFGAFVTARHVIKDVLDSDNRPFAQLRALQAVPNNKLIPRKVLGGSFNNDADVAVGICENIQYSDGDPVTCKILPMTSRIPEIGEQVVTYACPDVTTQEEATHIAANYYGGQIRKYYPNGRDSVVMPWPCYETSISIHGGASGGPVFDKQGNVFGVNCSSFEGAPDFSFVSRIIDVFGLKVEADHLVFPDGCLGTVMDLSNLNLATIV